MSLQMTVHKSRLSYQYFQSDASLCFLSCNFSTLLDWSCQKINASSDWIDNTMLFSHMATIHLAITVDSLFLPIHLTFCPQRISVKPVIIDIIQHVWRKSLCATQKVMAKMCHIITSFIPSCSCAAFLSVHSVTWLSDGVIFWRSTQPTKWSHQQTERSHFLKNVCLLCLSACIHFVMLFVFFRFRSFGLGLLSSTLLLALGLGIWVNTFETTQVTGSR